MAGLMDQHTDDDWARWAAEMAGERWYERLADWLDGQLAGGRWAAVYFTALACVVVLVFGLLLSLINLA